MSGRRPRVGWGKGEAASAVLLLAGVLLLPGPSAGQQQPAGAATLDAFTTVQAWSPHPSDGVTLEITADTVDGVPTMRLDFDFHGHAGYAIARRALDLDLPENYEFTFRVRGRAPPENLEFKLIDASGENVWWDDRLLFHFPEAWRTLITRKRQIHFAWGPAGGGEIRHAASMELVVTAGTGGKGTVWIADLVLRPLPPPHPYTRTPTVQATASLPGAGPRNALDGDTATAWHAPGGRETLTLDFLERREFGGLALDWGEPHAADYDVQLSGDGARWETVDSVRQSDGGRDWLYLPDSEARYLRLVLLRPAASAAAAPSPDPRTTSPGTYSLRELTVEPVAFGASIDTFFEGIARASPRGRFPRAYLGLQTYWTVVGAAADRREALLDTDGRLETRQASFSIEPFLHADGRLLGWADAATAQSLPDGDVPVPSVRWSADSLGLTVTAFTAGDTGGSTLYARYRVENRSRRPRRLTLFLALRAFQVNPPWQFLNTPGGVAEVTDVARHGRTIEVDGERRLVLLTPPDSFGATTFHMGAVPDWLARGTVPPADSVHDPFHHAGGALGYSLSLRPGEARDVWIAAPFYADAPVAPGVAAAGLGEAAATGANPGAPTPSARALAPADSLLAATIAAWRTRLGRVRIELPGRGAALARAIRANHAYVLIDADGAALQPGSRAYARAWIRDGALISNALLRLGDVAPVAAFIRWYAPYQFPDGKVPCCVDHRGADPVPENDSHGELIHLIAEYVRFTGDTALAAEEWEHVAGAVAYMDSLRASQMGPTEREGEGRKFFGLLPASISHEGYSAHPEHSYWDDLWGLVGYRDAAWLADTLGRPGLGRAISLKADTFQADILASMRLSMREHGIDYIPGSAELGDFDATSTTIGLEPAGGLPWLPEPALRNTFERYFRFVRARAAGDTAWDAYTPYEWRGVGAFVRLGEPARAHALADFLMRGRRPPAWNAWAEVVWHDAALPRFIGDIPHAWVGTDFIRSVLDMLAYVRARDGALVLGAAVDASWLVGPGLRIEGLRTRYGSLDLRMTRSGDVVHATLAVRAAPAGPFRVPAAGLLLRPPEIGRPLAAALLNGRKVALEDGYVRVPPGTRMPAVVELRYR